MVLPNGRAAAASFADNKLVYFGASDGLYVYNFHSKAADKYGETSDSIIDIATNKDGKHIYILSEDHKLYNVTNKGGNKELLKEVEDAMEFVLDHSENIYFYNSNKEVFIKKADGATKIQGLPKDAQSLKLINPPCIMEESVRLMLDNALYIVYANEIANSAGLEFSPNAKPTAYGTDVFLVQYYAYNKNLYELNLIALIAEKIFKKIHDHIENIRSNVERGQKSLGSKRS